MESVKRQMAETNKNWKQVLCFTEILKKITTYLPPKKV